MATVTLGNIKLNWKGAYNAGTAYAIDDVVSYNGSSYVAKTATTGNLPTVTANWDIMSQAGTNGTNGTNGTDVGTVITTQGDILYRDGSGLQRLPKGTAGQVLQMNSGATAPEYGTVSSDYVKLAKGAVTSDASYLEINGYFNDSIYHCYKVFIENIRWQNGGGDVNFRWTTSAGTTNSTNDYFILDGSYKTPTSNGYQNRASHNNSNINDFEGTWTNKHSSATSNAKEVLEGTIYQPQAGKAQFSYRYNTYHDSGGSTPILAISSGLYGTDQATAKTGFQLKKSSGTNIRTANWALYGIKK